MVIGIATMVNLWSLCILGIIAVTMVDPNKRFVVASLMGTNVLTYLIVMVKAVNKRRTNEIPQQT